MTIFVITTVSVMVGCWCGRKRKQYQSDVTEKGIPNDDSGGKQQVGLRISMLDERKVQNISIQYYCDMHILCDCIVVFRSK